MAKRIENITFLINFYSILICLEFFVSIFSDSIDFVLEKHGFEIAGLFLYFTKIVSIFFISLFLLVGFLKLISVWKNRKCKWLILMGYCFAVFYFFKIFVYLGEIITLLLMLHNLYVGNLLEYFASPISNLSFVLLEILMYAFVVTVLFFRIKKEISDYFSLTLSWLSIFLFVFLLKFVKLWVNSAWILSFLTFVIKQGLSLYPLINILYYIPIFSALSILSNHRKEIGELCI